MWQPGKSIKVQVKLINAGDEILVRRGLLAQDQVRSYKAEALVDTGAVSSVVPIHVVQQLGLALLRKTRAEYAKGSQENVDVTEAVGLDINGRRATEEMLVLVTEVLIGQTALERLDLQVDCVNNRLVPNPEHPDQPVLKIK